MFVFFSFFMYKKDGFIELYFNIYPDLEIVKRISDLFIDKLIDGTCELSIYADNYSFGNVIKVLKNFFRASF